MMHTIQVLLESVEMQKFLIIKTEGDQELSYSEKTEKLQEMRACLIRTQAAVCVLMQEELDNEAA